MKKILITGAAGFVGSHLTRRLVKEGYRVGIIERKEADFWRIGDLADKIYACEVDLRDFGRLREAVREFKPEAVVHLVVYYAVQHRPEELSLMLGTNVIATMNMLEAAREFGACLFINTSTCFVYGETDTPLNENAPLAPINLYALTKVQAEQACAFYASKYGLQTVTCRIFPPYGSDDHERRMIPSVIRSFLKGEPLLLTTGKQQWDFTYIGDVVEAYVRLLHVQEFSTAHEIFNIGTGTAVSVRDVVLRIKELIGSDRELEWGTVPHRKNEVWHIQADNTKARTLLKWQPTVAVLGDGLARVIKSYKKKYSE